MVCGTVFYDSPGSFEKEGRKSCSLKCRAVWQTGRPLAAPDSHILRFHEKRIIQNGCWGWSGATSEGYGVLGGPDQHNLYAHRLAWELVTGETLTSDDVICHICDNPPCTRNDDVGVYVVEGIVVPRRGHLFKGTDALNNKDMHQKGRYRPGRRPARRLHQAALLEP